MRFYLDEDLSPRVAEIARGLGLDAVSVHERGQHGFRDDELLRLAALEGRCFVTRNRDDFARLTVQFIENGWPHTRMLIVSRSLRNDDFAALAHALLAYSQRHPGDMEDYTSDYLAAG